MEGLIMAAQLILALAILVTFHEAGHYFAARAFGIRVEKFYLFFDAWGKKLFSFKKGETEYGIGWLPLGGYVKIAGMIDESVDTEQMKQPAQPYEFRSKPAWQRFIVMIGGIVVNLILGYAIFAGYLLNFEKNFIPKDAVNQDGIYAGVIAREIGLETGDKLISVNGNEYERFKDFASLEVFFGAELVIERDDQRQTIMVPGDFFKTLKRNKAAFIEAKSSVYIKELSDDLLNASLAGLKEGDLMKTVNGQDIIAYGHMAEMLYEHKGSTAQIGINRAGEDLIIGVPVDTLGRLGFMAEIKSYDGQRTSYSFNKALKYGFKDSWDVLYYNVVGIGKMFSGDLNARENLQGPVGIATIFGGEWKWDRFWKLTAMFSLILGFMNALPIPALDGGHMMFLIIEMVTGREPSDKTLLIAQYIGMALLLTLMVLVTWNDIMRIITG